jgi:hypothetical protein
MMANLSERDQRTVRFGGAAVGVILAFILVGFPVMDRWDKLNAEIADADKKLRSIEAGVQDAASASTTLRDLSGKASLYSDSGQLNQQTARMRQQVESLPGYNNLRVYRIEDMPTRGDDRVRRSAVSLQFSGRLGDIHEFLQALEATSPSLKVERFTVTADTRDTSRVEGQMVIAGYALVLGKG